MGQIIKTKKTIDRSQFIYPIPGSSGYSKKKKDFVSVYTEDKIIDVKIFLGMTGYQLKYALWEKIGKEVRIMVDGRLINYRLTLEQLGIKENSLIRAEVIDDDSSFISDLSKISEKSTKYSHRRTESAGATQKLSMLADFSKYSVPEVDLNNIKLSRKFKLNKKK
jgi:hypothetical protein